jgi:hypothetical protein
MSEIKKFYKDGFRSGLYWSDAWEDHTPGGPWVPSRRDNTQAREENKAWLEGWNAGHTQKILTKQVNPMRGTDANFAFHNGEK